MGKESKAWDCDMGVRQGNRMRGVRAKMCAEFKRGERDLVWWRAGDVPYMCVGDEQRKTEP